MIFKRRMFSMMRGCGCFRRAAVVLAVLLAWCGAAWLAVRPRMDASLFSLVGEKALNIPAKLQRLSATRVQAVITAATTNDAVDAAARFKAAVDPRDFATAGGDASALSGLLAFFMENAGGLVAPDDLARLEKGDFKFFTERQIRRLYTNPAPPLTPLEKDPFGLTERFLMSLPENTGAWRENGAGIPLAAEPDGRVSALVNLTLADAVASDTQKLPDVFSRLRGASAALPEGVAVEFSGVAAHTAAATERCRDSLASLTAFSTIFILAVAFLAFRSLKPLPLFILSLAVAACGGFAALITFCGDFHLLSCVFGTTVLGIVIDYSFHRLLAESESQTRSMLVSFATTEASLVPLAFSGLPVLTEAAVFIGFGLLAQLITVLWAYPVSAAFNSRSCSRREVAPSRQPSPKAVAIVSRNLRAFAPSCDKLLPFPALKFLALAILMLAVFGFAAARFATPMTALYKPTPALLAAETHLRALNGESPNETLERIFPPLETRRRNAALVTQLYRGESAALASALDMKPFAPPAAPKDLVLNPERLFAEFLSRTTALTTKLLAGTALVIAAILLAVFRRRALLVAVPSLAAVGSVFAALALRGESVTLFHLLAAFMLIGISIDYAVFMAGDARRALKPVVCSFLTSLAGFGALVFVPFPIVQAVGLTLAVGLTAALIITLAIFRPTTAASAYAPATAAPAPATERGTSAAPTSAPSAHATESTSATERGSFAAAAPAAPAPAPEQTEQSASALGMATLWWLYRIFGARVYRSLTACVAAVVWCANPKVRRNCRRFARLQNFTQGMADKLLAMGGGADAVKVAFEDTPAARDFARAMASPEGLFIISSHLGTIEVLPAAAESAKTLRAFMRVKETAVFNQFYAKRQTRRNVVVENLESFSIGDFFRIGAQIDAGDAVLMAGDRAYGRTRPGTLGGAEMDFPAGVFRLAELLARPVFFVFCVRVGSGAYRAIVRRADADEPLFEQYLKTLEPLVQTYPDQWYHWK